MKFTEKKSENLKKQDNKFQNKDFFYCFPLIGEKLISDKDIKCHRFIYFRDNSSIIHLDDGSERTPSEGTVCYIAPKIGYYISSDSVNPAVSGIACCGSFADTLASACNAVSVHISLRPSVVDAFNEAMELSENISEGIEEFNRRSLAFHKLFVELIFAQTRIVESKHTLLAQHIKKYIDENLDTDISVASIAKQFYLSETHVIRIFRERYGITPKQYILQTKVAKAKNLLLDTTLQIKEIAMTLHFADSYHFSHTFKRMTGISPEKFRMREDERRR